MTLLLFPGAGSSAEHPSLQAIEAAIDPHPCRRVDFPYRIAGRRAPDRAPVLMAAVRTAIDEVPAAQPLVLGGRSMGGRMCSMIAAGADGQPPPPNLVGLALICYPLHPPGKPDRLRVDHLPSISVPTLFVSGSNDPFGSPAELERWIATMAPAAESRLVVIPGKGHDLRGVDAVVAGHVAEFMAALTS